LLLLKLLNKYKIIYMLEKMQNKKVALIILIIGCIAMVLGSLLVYLPYIFS